ncbi:ionotropic receptor 25a [Patella vulgata]|uniref:ionotropic receptor 25a n=1 Tax=Patella vulgata TaxID=6465 RepID=UPI0021805340|nr:ionotropic receptor 25a [Patella vulgata]XP_050390555.1 ionotropic receptor 25a [Patella vulgata]
MSLLPVLIILTCFSCCLTSNIVILTDNDDIPTWTSLNIFTNQNTDVNIFSYDVTNENDTLASVQFLCRNYHPGSTIVLDVTHSCSVADLGGTIFTPWIRPSYTGCHCHQTSSLQASHDVIISVAFDYVRRQRNKLAKIIIFTDSCQYSPSILDSVNLTVPVLLINPKKINISQWLTKIKHHTIRHYQIVIGTAFQVNHILCTAKYVGLPEAFRYIIHVLDNPSNIDLTCVTSQYVLIESTVSKPSYNQDSLDAISKLPGISEILWPWLQSILPTLPQTFDPSANICNGPVTINNPVIPPIGGIQNEFNLIEITKLYNTDQQKQIGRWTLLDGYLAIEGVETFHKNHLMVATIHEPPFVFREETENGTIYRGYTVDVFNEIASRLDLTYTMYEVPDKQYGRKNPDGTWSGLVGEILKGSADMVVAPVSVTADREAVLDFTSPYYDFAGIQIMMKKPDDETSFMTFTFVFSSTLWLCWFAVLLITGGCIYIFERSSPYSPRNTPGGYYTIIDKKEKYFGVVDSYWYVAASLSLYGPEFTPRTFSTRLLISGFWLFCTIIMANYIANLAAVLTTSRLTVPIDSLDDLAKQTRIKYSLKRGTVIQDYFERMANIERNFYDLWRNMSYGTSFELRSQSVAVFDYPLGDQYLTIKTAIERTGLLTTSEEGLNKVLTEDFAMIHESPMLQYELSQDCRLIAVGKQFSSKPYAFALPQKSPLTKLISKTILQLQSEVVLDALQQKWWTGDNSNQSCSTIDESDGLTFHTVGGIFLVVIFGMGLGLLVSLVEIMWYNIRPRAQSKIKQHTLNEQNSRTNLADDFDSIPSVDTINSAESVNL